jgi:hypothetical protein
VITNKVDVFVVGYLMLHLFICIINIIIMEQSCSSDSSDSKFSEALESYVAEPDKSTAQNIMWRDIY